MNARNQSREYARRIRNPFKREYAERYIAWREKLEGAGGGFDWGGGPEEKTGPAGRLSYLSRQAVRMAINEFFDAPGAW